VDKNNTATLFAAAFYGYPLSLSGNQLQQNHGLWLRRTLVRQQSYSAKTVKPAVVCKQKAAIFLALCC
jgi:hypothetical protein